MRDYREEFKNIPPSDWNMIREHPEKWPAWSGAYDESEWEIKEEWVEEVLDALDVCMKERDELKDDIIHLAKDCKDYMKEICKMESYDNENRTIIRKLVEEKDNKFTIEEVEAGMRKAWPWNGEKVWKLLKAELLKSRGGK